MSTAPAFASVGEALDMVRAGLGYLAAADAAQLPAATQAEALRELERTDAAATAARAGFLAAFTAGAGPAGDGDYSAVSWLIHRTGITRGAAVGHSAWAKRVATHPRVLAALAAGQVSESVGRVICLWTDKLPQEHRDAGDEQLLAASAAGLGLARPGVAVRGDVRPGPGGSAGSGSGAGVRGPGGEAGHHDRRRRGDARGPDRRVRRGRRGGAGRAVGPGREGRRPDQGAAVPRRAGRGDAPADRQRHAAGAGRAAGQDLGPHLPGRPAPPAGQFGAAGGVDRPGAAAVGRAPRGGVRDRRVRRRVAGRRRRRGHRLRRRDGARRHRRCQRGRAGGSGPAVRRVGPAPPHR